MQFSFMLGRSTIDAIYILRQSRRNILFGKIKNTLFLLILKRPLTGYLVLYFGTLRGSWELINEFLGLQKLCAMGRTQR